MGNYKRILYVDDHPDKNLIINFGGEPADIEVAETMDAALKALALNEGGPFRYDKILLDMYFPLSNWDEDNEYHQDVFKVLSEKMLKKWQKEDEKCGGVVLLKYLLSKGFPLQRIAYFSNENGIEKKTEQKPTAGKLGHNKSGSGFVRQQKSGNTSAKPIGDVTDMLAAVDNTEDGNPDEKAQEQLKNGVNELVEKIAVSQQSEVPDETGNEGKCGSYFNQLEEEGYNIKSFPKSGAFDEVNNWLVAEENDTELDDKTGEKYYKLRCLMLNVCDELIDKYKDYLKDKDPSKDDGSFKNGEEKNSLKYKYLENLLKYKNKNSDKFGIYGCVNNLYDFREKYPPKAIIFMLENVKRWLDIDVDKDKLAAICAVIINELCLPWEAAKFCNPILNTRYKNDSNAAKNNSYAAANTLKFARNMIMHSLVDDKDDIKDEADIKKKLRFMEFVFVLSAYVLSGPNEDDPSVKKKVSEALRDYLIKLYNDPKSESYKKLFEEQDIWEQVISKFNEPLSEKKQGIQIPTLFDEYGKCRSEIGFCDFYAVYYAGLRYPTTEDDRTLCANNEIIDDFFRYLACSVYNDILDFIENNK